MISGVPHLRCYLNLMALEGMRRTGLDAIREAGYDGVQFVEPVTAEQANACRRLGLGMASSGRISEPRDAAPLAERFAAEGVECATIHLGWGLEDDDAAHRLIEAGGMIGKIVLTME